MNTFMNYYSALVPMSDGKIAIHGTEISSEATAQRWADNRFSKKAVVILNSDYPELFNKRFTGEDDPELKEWRQRLLKIYKA